MKYLRYGGEALLVSGDAADATLAYCSALAQAGLTDVVHLPIVDADGCSATASLVLGPAIPLLAIDAPDDVLEPDDAAYVREVGERTSTAQQSVCDPRTAR